MPAVSVQIRRFVDDHQPGFVECVLVDAFGDTHTFVEKAPIVSAESLFKASTFPCHGEVQCEIGEEWRGEMGRTVAKVCTEKPWGIKSIKGITEFTVFSSQLRRSANMERVLLPNKTKTLLVVVASSLLFCALFLYAAMHAGLRSVGWPLLCGAIGIAIYAMQLHPGVTYLKLTHRGFEYKNYLYARFIEWKDVRHFTMYRYRGLICYVGWFYSEHYSGTKLPFPKMMGIEGYFRENFGHKAKDLASLLEEWRQKNSNEP
jgi:hypothetical protein